MKIKLNPKEVNRRTKAEISEIGDRKIIEKISETKSCFLKKKKRINKINKPPDKPTKKQKERKQITNIRSGREKGYYTDPTKLL